MSKNLWPRGAAVAAAWIAAVHGAGAATSTTQYHVVAIGGTDARTAGMNSAAVVAGSVGFVPALLDHGAITMLGSNSGSAQAVNGLSNATGTFYPGGQVHAFLWKNGSIRDIGTLHESSDASHGMAINHDGVVLCVEYAPDGAYTFTFLNGVKTPVPGPKGYTYVQGAAMNDSGDVAGAATPPGLATHAFARIGGVSTDLGASGGKNVYSTATAINLSGVVAGDTATQPGTTADVVAFRWTSGTLSKLGTLGASTRSHALAINGKGTIVGYSYADAGNTISHAFMHDGTKISDLNKRLDAASAGWVLETATGIDDAGAITGMGVFGGDRMPYLATPVKAAR